MPDELAAASLSKPAGVLRDDVGAFLRELVERGELVRVRVSGSSMSPFIRCGDVVTVAPRDRGRPPRRGEVVVYLRGERWLVVHRVVDPGPPAGGWVLTRGDGVRQADRPVAGEEIFAVVRRVDRGRRRVRFGLGPERRILALLSRRGWLVPLLGPLRRLVRWVRAGGGRQVRISRGPGRSGGGDHGEGER